MEILSAKECNIRLQAYSAIKIKINSTNFFWTTAKAMNNNPVCWIYWNVKYSGNMVEE